jgi:hypothetical protein
MVGCRPHGASGFDFEVAITGGLNVVSLTANFSSGFVPCIANPAMSNSFNCPLSMATLGTPSAFDAVFSDGTTANHVFDNLSSLIPADCPGSGDPQQPGGGICADNTSVSTWRNPVIPEDVNNDGCITPADTLAIIARINAVGSGFLAVPRPAGSPFFDVNGDGSISAYDALITSNYLNTHVNVPCTPTCTNTSPNDWSLEAVCNPSGRPANTVEFRAHFPGSRTDVTGFGLAESGCDFGPDPANGTISRFCPIGMAYPNPMLFWVQRTDGSVSQHSFTNAADLASACTTPNQAPNFVANAVCNTTNAGTYDLGIAWYPTDYSVSSVRDSTGAVIAGCGACTDGSCHCTAVSPESDGMIHLQMDHLEGSTDVFTPLDIRAGSCSNSGWRLTGGCYTGAYASPNEAVVHITSPASLHLTASTISVEKPGLLFCADGALNVINCGFDLNLTPRDPLEIHFPSPDGGMGSHTFADFDAVMPASCIPTGNTAGTLHFGCSGGTPYMTISEPDWTSIGSVTMNGDTPSRANTTGLGSRMVVITLNPGLAGTRADIHIYGTAADGSDIDYDWSGQAVPSCEVITPTLTPTPRPNNTTPCNYSNPNTCGSGGCHWWYSDNSCHTDQEPPSCSSYSDSNTCKVNNCTWNGKSCQ